MSPFASFQVAKTGLRASLNAAPMVMAAVLAVGLHANGAQAAEADAAPSASAAVKQVAQDARNEAVRAANAYEGLRQRMYGARAGSWLASMRSESGNGTESATQNSGSTSTGTYGTTAARGAAVAVRQIYGAIDYTKPYRPGER